MRLGVVKRKPRLISTVSVARILHPGLEYHDCWGNRIERMTSGNALPLCATLCAGVVVCAVS